MSNNNYDDNYPPCESECPTVDHVIERYTVGYRDWENETNHVGMNHKDCLEVMLEDMKKLITEVCGLRDHIVSCSDDISKEFDELDAECVKRGDIIVRKKEYIEYLKNHIKNLTIVIEENCLIISRLESKNEDLERRVLDLEECLVTNVQDMLQKKLPERVAVSDPSCPVCGNMLEEVPRHSTWMNDEQYASVKAGDWYCINCTDENTKSGFMYFKDSDFAIEGR